MLTAQYDKFSGVMDDIEGQIAGSATSAMRRTAKETRDRLRQQTRSAGLGSRLPNTWSARAYPVGAKNSINPAGLVYSRAPDIMDAFTRGATIRPIGGDHFLWIPTKNVPRARPRSRGTAIREANGSITRPKRLRGGAITPEECETRFNTEFVVKKGRSGRRLAFMDLVAGRAGGARKPTAGRARQGRKPKLTLMFVLTKTAKMPKLFDLDREADAWANAFEREFTEGLPA